MRTNQVEFIEPEEFIYQVLEESPQAYLYHIIVIESYLPQIHLFQMAQIFSAIAKPVTISEAYKDFEDVFYTKNAGHLPVHKDHDHAIDLVDDKELLYGHIYSLSKNELSIL